MTLKQKKEFLNKFNYTKSGNIRWYPHLKELVITFPKGATLHYYINKRPYTYSSRTPVMMIKTRNYNELVSHLITYEGIYKEGENRWYD